MIRAYGSWIPTANLASIPNSIKNNLKDVCIDKGLKPACPVGRPVAIEHPWKWASCPIAWQAGSRKYRLQNCLTPRDFRHPTNKPK